MRTEGRPCTFAEFMGGACPSPRRDGGGPASEPGSGPAWAGRGDELAGDRDQAGQGRAIPTLDSRGYNVGGVAGRVERRVDVIARGKRCRARMCPKCGPVIGRRVRERLLERAAVLGMARPVMLTLTVDRDGSVTHRGFGSPAAAHAEVALHRRIPELMRRLECDTWAWVLEFTKSGWPHWHVLMDAGRCPEGRVDYNLAWHLWRKLWRIGGLKFPEKSRGFRDAGHAVRYITKYLIKYPTEGFPSWVLDLHRIRFVGSSARIGALVAGFVDPSEDPHQGDDPIQEEETEGGEDQREGKPVPYRTRVKQCSERCELWRRETSETGTSFRWIGEVDASPAELGQMLDEGLLGMGHCEPQVGRGPEMVFAATARAEDIATCVRRLRASGWCYVSRYATRISAAPLVEASSAAAARAASESGLIDISRG